jgi:hypothetical protein
MNFRLSDLKRGRREMEKTITTVGRIRRQFSGGRPPKPGSWETRSALRTIMQRTDAIVAALKGAKLDPRDMNAVIVVGELLPSKNLDTSHIDVKITTEWLMEKGKSHLSGMVDKILPDPAKVIIGVVYSILDHEMSEPKYRLWANPAYRDIAGEAEIALAAVLKRMEVTGKPGDYSA